MKLYDFDSKFYDYVRTWMAIHPGLNENQVEERYNEMMESWLNAPANWLDGAKPGEYFNRYESPKELLKLTEEYLKRDMGLPEPLYRRVVDLGDACAMELMKLARDEGKPEALRATAISMLRDIDTKAPMDMYIDMVCACREEDELSEMAADILSASGDASVVGPLMDRYDGAPEYAKTLILDICSNYPGDARLYDRLLERLRNCPDQRALYAALIGKLDDPRAIEPLKSMLNLVDLTYLDYIELRSAIEKLGGDPGEERTFNGDPDFEALRNI